MQAARLPLQLHYFSASSSRAGCFWIRKRDTNFTNLHQLVKALKIREDSLGLPSTLQLIGVNL
ncbi:MAG: hypothetical protein DME33_01730 [Verrucomicrobia bacterium]|nr:MAG: hypothetical protein DME33_01730 [Verrucomicrobiota bacterium]